MRISRHTPLPRLGELADPLHIEVGNRIPDSYGGFQIEWQPYLQVWGRVEVLVPSQPDERWDFVQHHMVGRYWVWVRQGFTLKEPFRFRWEEKILLPQTAPLKIGKQYWVFLGEDGHAKP